jgi:hypothetical protein
MTKLWECWDCGHIFELENRPHLCPKCLNVHLMNKDAFFIELPLNRKPKSDLAENQEIKMYPSFPFDQNKNTKRQ